jgi:DNA topoisomerase-2
MEFCLPYTILICYFFTLYSDYKEYHTDTTVKFVVTLSADKMMEAEAVGFHKKFKLESSLNTSNLVLFDKDGCLKKYPNVMEILKEFYEVRVELYGKRKDWLVGQLEAEAAKLTNQARFIMEKIEGKVVIGELLMGKVNYES